ncbi:Hypothetical predicted protein [Pelobates cultripes]|uniref:Uncharacterized protein n=1 Tax=Pelobates cultripes TaxID=61616 RepID=A0AAD1T5L5_PELCU|nr:Hypothetical predicted protein [Pelobates cultripes]
MQAPRKPSLPPQNGRGDPGPPLGGSPAILGTQRETTETAGKPSEPPSMADATWHHHPVNEQRDLMARLDRIFDKFWQDLEKRRYHTISEQQRAHSPSQQIVCPQQTPTVSAKVPKWRRRKNNGTWMENSPNQDWVY